MRPKVYFHASSLFCSISRAKLQLGPERCQNTGDLYSILCLIASCVDTGGGLKLLLLTLRLLCRSFGSRTCNSSYLVNNVWLYSVKSSICYGTFKLLWYCNLTTITLYRIIQGYKWVGWGKNVTKLQHCCAFTPVWSQLARLVQDQRVQDYQPSTETPVSLNSQLTRLTDYYL